MRLHGVPRWLLRCCFEVDRGTRVVYFKGLLMTYHLDIFMSEFFYGLISTSDLVCTQSLIKYDYNNYA